VPPEADPSGILYLLEGSATSDAGRVTAVNPDGTVRTGWPVTLQRQGSIFESITLGPAGLAYPVAVEPEAGDGRSITILAIDRDSTVLWTRTIAEP